MPPPVYLCLNMLTKWCVLSVFFTAALAKQHSIELWEDEEFQGTSIEVLNRKPRGVEFCNTMGQDWWDRVSSLNTKLNCYEIYDGTQCTGDVRFMYPGSPSHNKLTDLNFNDRMKSFRLCDLDETVVPQLGGALNRRSMDPRRPERGFWELLFGRFSASYLRAFLARSQRSWFIRWDFIPNVFGSSGQQYQYALEWAEDVINAGNFDRATLEEMRRRAQDVVDDRAERNRRYASSSAGSRSDAVHRQLEFIWRQVVETIDAVINRANDDDDEDDELGR